MSSEQQTNLSCTLTPYNARVKVNGKSTIARAVRCKGTYTNPEVVSWDLRPVLHSFLQHLTAGIDRCSSQQYLDVQADNGHGLSSDFKIESVDATASLPQEAALTINKDTGDFSFTIVSNGAQSDSLGDIRSHLIHQKPYTEDEDKMVSAETEAEYCERLKALGSLDQAQIAGAVESLLHIDSLAATQDVDAFKEYVAKAVERQSVARSLLDAQILKKPGWGNTSEGAATAALWAKGILRHT